MTPTEKKFAHLNWAIESRFINQRCALKIFKMIETNKTAWKTKRYARAAQDLIAASFSLWRAAFLADKEGKRAFVLDHGLSFLERILEDNAISYPNDKASREWTFNYYTRNARSSLQQLHEFWPNIAPRYEGAKRSPQQRWDYCQSLLNDTVDNFDKTAREKSEALMKSAQKKSRRQTRKAQRKIVRKLTLQDRTIA